MTVAADDRNAIRRSGAEEGDLRHTAASIGERVRLAATARSCNRWSDRLTMTAAPAAANAITGVIGGTPAVWLDRLTAGLPGRILLKLELLNPGGSIKDRAALQ